MADAGPDAFAKVRARAEAALAEEGGFAHRVTLDFGEAGALHVDGPAGRVTEEAAPADCTVTVSLSDFVAIAKGRLNPAAAYMSGRLKVAGDAGLALALAKRLGG